MFSRMHQLFGAFVPLRRFSSAKQFHNILVRIAFNSAEATRNFVDEMQSRGIAPDSTVHELMVVALCNEKQFKQAKKYALRHQSADKRELEITLVRETAKRGGADVVMQMYNGLLKPTMEISKALILELSAKKELLRILEIVRKLRANGHEIDTFIYNEVIRVYHHLNNSIEAAKMIDEMKKKNVPMNHVSFAYFSRVYMALKKHDKVEELLRMMWEQDNEEEISFNAIIHFLEYYASKEDWKSVESIFEKLKERKIELNNPTKEKINELGKKSERMQSFTITYSALLNEDTKPENSDSDFMENHEETREILEAILLSSFNPKVLESAFSRYLDLNCHFSHVMQVYSNLKKKYHLSNFPKLIVARYKNYDDVLDDVFKFAKEEYETRKEIEIYDFNSFMIKYLDLQRYNKVEEVLEFISMHEDMGRTPKTYVFAARYLNQLRKDGKLNQYLNNLLAKPSKPSLVYTSLIDFGIDLFGFEEINTALEGFSKFGFDPKADLAKRMKMRELREKSAKTENTVQEGEKNHKETLPNPESQNTK